MARAVCPVVLAILLSLTLAGSAAAQLQLWLPRSELRITAGAAAGGGELLLEAAVQATAPPGLPVVVDETPAGSKPTVSFYEVSELPASSAPDRRTWRLRATVTEAPTGGLFQQRRIKVTWGTSSTSLPYVFTNVALPPLNWSVKGLPAQWQAKPGECLPLRVVASGARATGIVLTNTLVDQSTKRMLGQRLFVAVNDARADTRVLEVAINDRPSVVALCLESTPAPGKYEGLVNLSAAEKPEGDPATVAVFVTSWWARTRGGALLVLGSLLAYILRVRAPGSIARQQTLLPASVLRERIAVLQARLDALLKGAPPGTEMRKGRRALADLAAGLETNALDGRNFLPPKVPSPFRSAPDAAAYKQHLEDSAAALSRWAIAVIDGLEAALPFSADTRFAAVMLHVDDLPGAQPPPTVPELSTKVKQLVDSLKPAAVAAAAMAAAPRTLDSDSLVLQIEQTSAVLWSAGLLLTAIIGFFVLVLSNPGFGVPADYLYCLIWAFGLPMALPQLTGASGTTALGLSFPKIP
jgi:hypothetical protein